MRTTSFTLTLALALLGLGAVLACGAPARADGFGPATDAARLSIDPVRPGDWADLSRRYGIEPDLAAIDGPSVRLRKVEGPLRATAASDRLEAVLVAISLGAGAPLFEGVTVSLAAADQTLRTVLSAADALEGATYGLSGPFVGARIHLGGMREVAAGDLLGAVRLRFGGMTSGVQARDLVPGIRFYGLTQGPWQGPSDGAAIPEPRSLALALLVALVLALGARRGLWG